MSPDERLFAASVQGLVNRKQPRLYLNSADTDLFWLDVLKERKLVKGARECAGLQQLAEMYKDELGGLVVTDPKLTITVNIATIVSAVKGLAIATPSLAEHLPLPIGMDLRGKWKTEDEAYQWAYDRFWRSMNHGALSWAYPGEDYHLERDYLVQNKIWPVWICGKIDGAQGGSSAKVERFWTDKVMSETPGNIPIFGFPYAGENVGIGEMGGTTIASAYAKYNVCTSINPNLSVHSGYPPAKVKLRRTPEPRFDSSKAYVAFILSDGDNLLTFNGSHLPLWKQRPANRPPVCWSIGPAAAIVMPEIVRWYYRTALPGDTFITDVSGAGYMYPAIYGQKYSNRSLLSDYARFTAELSKMMDIRTLALHDFMGTMAPHYEVFASEWPDLVGIFADYTRRTGMTQMRAGYKLQGGVPVLHALVGFDISPDREVRITKAVEDIRKATKSRPAFVNAFMVNWVSDPDECAEIMKRLGDGYVTVSPETLASFAAARVPDAPPERNLALTAWVSNPDNHDPCLPVDPIMNDRFLCDGNTDTYWDETHDAGDYLLRLDFMHECAPKRMEIVGYQQENFAPKSFDIICDGKVVQKVEDLRYHDNLAVIDLPGVPCTRLELRIRTWYAGSPAIRELRVYE
jgi:hypothetical protein